MFRFELKIHSLKKGMLFGIINSKEVALVETTGSSECWRECAASDDPRRDAR